MLEPPVAAGQRAAAARTLRFTITDSAWSDPTSTALVPDHGKLMHLFLVGPSGAFAHLHPVRQNAATFDAALPDLPGGRYRVFADMVHENGLARTLVVAAAVPALGAIAVPTGGASAGDDAWAIGVPAGAGVPVASGGGLTIATVTPSGLPVGRDTALRFVVRDASGAVADLEPSMGMAAHAIVMRDDGSVFAHLHPMGTVSMAAQQQLLRRERRDPAPADRGATMDGMGSMGGAHTAHGVATPYPGALSWVQVRRGGVHTAVFGVVAS